MCTFAFYFQMFSDYPIIAAANRDESLSRPSAPPIRLWDSPWVYGGQDLLAGGTWLGINQHGMLVAVLNRHTPSLPDPQRRSRGLLCLDALKQRSVGAAVNWVMAQSVDTYNPFNLVIADAVEAYVIYGQPGARDLTRLIPGFHLLTNYNVNDQRCFRTVDTSARFTDIAFHTAGLLSHQEQIFSQLHVIMATHATGKDPRAGVCLHHNGYGTCSSTLLALSAVERRYTYAFAPGPPCRHTYSEVSIPLGGAINHPPSTT